VQKYLSLLLQISLFALGCLIYTSKISIAQVTSDGTVNTQVNQNENVSEITGGERQGDNLFHSFQDFSVGTGNEAAFLNANDIANIFSRVTGGNISNIDGLISANGSANLFLINPAGILFGENARLDVGGSFLGSTADSILFEDGEFSATDLNTPPVLTINAPIGLNLRNNPQPITNQSRVNDGNGLQVDTGKNITLIGGKINFDGGRIFAPGGNVELGGLLTAGEIGINSNGSLSFPDGVARSDVSFQNVSIVYVLSGGGGNITVNARNFELLGSAFLAGIGSGLGSPDAQAGDININATDNVALDGQSGNFTAINNSVSDNAIGNAGEINISAGNISLNNGGQINSFVTGQGNSSDISLNARENISINGSNDAGNSGVSSFIAVSGEGNSGTTNITAQNLTLSNGGDISSDVAGVGDSGDININVKDSLTVDGEGILSIPSAINSRVGPDAQGNSGDIRINTSKLSLRNGGQINASIFSRGNAGNIDINSTESITINGIGSQGGNFSGINSSVLPTAEGNAGDIEITTNRLSLTNGGSIDASTSGIGNAGNINIDATESITIDGISPQGVGFSGINSLVGSTAEGNGGNIQISTGDFTISNDATVDASTFGRGDGGEINITANNLSLTNGGDINAITFRIVGDNITQGNGGNININVADTLSIDGTSTVEFQGQVAESPAGIFAGNLGNTIDNGGNIDITASKLSLTNGTQITSFNRGGGNGGNINLKIDDTLTMRNNSLISAQAFNNANGGNVNIDANFIIAFPNENSLNGNNDIRANAQQGQGGIITINTESLLGIQERKLNPQTNDINASSDILGLDGTVNINTPDINPVQGATELPSNVIEAEQTTEQACQANREAAARNNLIINGKGGIPPTPDLPLTSQNIIVIGQYTDDTYITPQPVKTSQVPLTSQNTIAIGQYTDDTYTTPEPVKTSQGMIQPARGIKVTEDGGVILTAYPTNNAGERIPEGRMNCGQI
jgi:filamentous hemagglutinin family protein